MIYMDTKTASVKWSLTERRLTMLCREGRIDGAKKENGVWLIPDDAIKPNDRRKKKTDFNKSEKKLPLPIGVSNYKKLVETYYYVDKTMLLKEFLDEKPQVSLFTRPRRFGKTLMMDMIKTFFEISDQDNSIYFRNKKIWNCGQEYQQQQGKYPVIFVTFKDIKFDSWEETFVAIQEEIATEYQRHKFLLESEKSDEYDKAYFRKMVSGEISKVSMIRAFSVLSRMLNSYYDQSVIIIIDEYDTPIQQGYVMGFYDQVVGFMRNLLSAAFKDNSNLAYGFLTGILRVAKESIFSGLNNLAVHSINDNKYSEYFGFTSSEVKQMCDYYDVKENYQNICEWYDGYRFGEEDIFNPWSVINYFYNKCVADAYWQSTGDNSIICQIVSQADENTIDNLRKLMQGQVVSSYINSSVIYPEIQKDPTTIYSFLLAAGYLKIASKKGYKDGTAICEIAIPNKEISIIFESEILSAYSNMISPATSLTIQEAIIQQDNETLQETLQELLLNSVSYFDYANETFYHGLILGLCAVMNNRYKVDSNRESGLGRYDIQLTPYNKKLPGVIIEIKVINDSDCSEDKLESMAKRALKQIGDMHYEQQMKANGITRFFKIGVAFHKKHVKLMCEE